MLKVWWEMFPGRLDHELDSLKQLGIDFSVDSSAFKNQRLEVHFNLTVDAEQFRLRARFPDLYPFFRFEIFAEDLEGLRHHHNPFQKNLCVIGSATENWHTHDTLASFLTEQVPRAIRAGRTKGKDEVGDLEIHQAEPLTAYYTYQPDSIILVEGPTDTPANRGLLTIDIQREQSPFVRGALTEIQDESNQILYTASSEIRQLFSQTIKGRWARLDEPILESNPKHFLRVLFQKFPQFEQPRWVGVRGFALDVIGVLFRDEVKWRAEGDAWMFVVRFLRDRPGFRPGHYWEAYFAMPGLIGTEIFSRVPELKPLRSKGVAVVGLGCVGGHTAVDFARSGIGRIHIMDSDTVEPGIGVRWPLGLTAAGSKKTQALEKFIKANWPYTQIRSWPHRLGDAVGSEQPDRVVIEEFLAGMDLLVDASAEIGVSNALSSICRERGIPFITISTTPGGWGGRISRFVPQKTEGCWHCLQHSLREGIIPPSPYNPAESIQPTGCASPTFTGANFDIQEISLQGVRLAVSTLCRSENAYPDFDWDVGVLSLRDEAGHPIPPTWQVFKLGRHRLCESCQREELHGLARASST